MREAAYKQIDACFQLLGAKQFPFWGKRYMKNRPYMVKDRRAVLDPYLFVFCRWGKSLPKPFTDYPNLHRFLMQMADDARVQRAMQEQLTTL